MKKILYGVLFTFCLHAMGQGKYYGGDSPDPASYSGVSLFHGPPLFVNYESFQAEQDRQHLLITWSTLAEENNEYFEVQKLIDNKHYGVVGRVNGSGTTHVHHRYSLIDYFPQAGINYYRLIQVDYDGTESISDNFSAVFIPAGQVIYPVPSKDVIHLPFLSPNAVIHVHSLEGKEVKVDINGQQMDIRHLTEGQYFLNIYLPNDKTISNRFIKIR
ncbi:T9SS type A sorting domain-containing protein [Reichenbachiella sp.]